MIIRPMFSEFFEFSKISPKILSAYHIKKQADHGLTRSTILHNNLLPFPSPAPSLIKWYHSLHKEIMIFSQRYGITHAGCDVVALAKFEEMLPPSHASVTKRPKDLVAVRGSTRKMPFFWKASGPILSIPIHSKVCQYDPCKVSLKKMTPSLPMNPPKSALFGTTV